MIRSFAGVNMQLGIKRSGFKYDLDTMVNERDLLNKRYEVGADR